MYLNNCFTISPAPINNIFFDFAAVFPKVVVILKTEKNRERGTLEVSRVFSNGIIILSVWRKWRLEVRDRIIPKIRLKLDHWDVYNVELPWKDSKGNITATRFYHYFTFQELTGILKTANLHIIKFQRSGGKHKDANFFCFVLKDPKQL